MASKRRCYWCGSRDFPRVLVQRWSGKVEAVCEDGAACVRRKMAAEGVELLPHPKNPEPA